MTETDDLNGTQNLLSDLQYWVEWADETGLLQRLAREHPWVRINKMTVRQYLHRAVGLLVQSGTRIQDIWGVPDLVTSGAFRKIVHTALALSPASANCMALVLLTTAREWVGVGEKDLKVLQAIAAYLPLVKGRSFNRRQRLQTALMHHVAKQDISKAKASL